MAFAMLAVPGMAQVTVNLPAGSGMKELKVSHALTENMLSARSNADLKISEQTVAVAGDKASFNLDPSGAARYSIDITPEVKADFYAAPGETVNVNITSLDPLAYSVSGTPLMDGMSQLEQLLMPLELEQQTLQSAGTLDRDKMMELYSRQNEILLNFIKDNSDSPAAVYALLNLNGEDFVESMKTLGDNARKSILYPFAERQYEMVNAALEKERKQKALIDGHVDAPAFTLPDLDGRLVSLSDFKGKWVILDFWGAWCPWCIKGFPALKEAYAKYKDRLEVIGIDCREDMNAWKAGVAKYELPWVNVYSDGKENPVEERYQVQGFPTKVIINPEGKIADIVTGEDPEFFTRLAELMK